MPTAPRRYTWYQPIGAFATWKARGCDGLVGYESNGGTVTLDQYLASAAAAGLTVFLQSTALRPQDLVDPRVEGVLLLPDEPDAVGATPPDVMQAAYQQLKAQMRAAGVDKPVLLNVDGNKIPWRSNDDYKAYAKACDWYCFDKYVTNFGGTAEDIHVLADFARQLRADNDLPTDKVGACIETGNQLLSRQPWTQANDATGTPLSPKMRGPTADEFRQELDAVNAAGVDFVIYFASVIGAGWVDFDGTTPEVEAVMKSYAWPAPGAVSAATGAPTPTVTPTATPTVTPTPTPPVIPAVTPLPWTLARDLKRQRWQLQLPPLARGKPVRYSLVTDPADVALLDAIAAKYPPK
jgi:hypothetical protein